MACKWYVMDYKYPLAMGRGCRGMRGTLAEAKNPMKRQNGPRLCVQRWKIRTTFSREKSQAKWTLVHSGKYNSHCTLDRRHLFTTSHGYESPTSPLSWRWVKKREKCENLMPAEWRDTPQGRCIHNKKDCVYQTFYQFSCSFLLAHSPAPYSA